MPTQLQQQILGKIIEAESLSTLMEELQQPEPIIRNELRQLIDKRWAQPMRWDESRQDYVPSLVYDADDMHGSRYRVTALGLRVCGL